MNKQEEFLQKITELREISKLQNHVISEEQAKDFIKENNLNKEQESFFYDYLKDNNIGIGETPQIELSSEDESYLDIYLEELKELPSYLESELLVISRDAMAGDEEAKVKLITAYLPQVVDIAKLYAGQGALLEDLIGEGNVALSQAVALTASLEKAEEVQGMLGREIMEAMELFIEDLVNSRKADEKIEKKVNKVADKARELSEELRRDVTVTELCEEGLTLKEIGDALEFAGGKIEGIEG